MELKNSGFTIIIPAAGSSKRLGQSKQLVRIREMSLIRRTCLTASASIADNIIVITGYEHKIIEAALPSNDSLRTLYNNSWQKGMNNGIRLALENLLKSDERNHIMIFMADQYRINSSDLTSLIRYSQARPSQIIASSYSKTIGVPCIFPCSFIAEILDLDQNLPLKLYLKEKEREGKLSRFALESAAFDLDTPEDLIQFRNYYETFENKQKP